MFSIQIDDQSEILRRLLELYVKPESKIIDYTYGKGGLWNFKHTYDLVKCDKEPKDGVLKKDLVVDEYDELGSFDVGLFDPPYLIGRYNCFDYSKHNLSQEFQREEGFKERHVMNQSVQSFNERVEWLNKKANCNLLFVKVMDVRNKGKIVPHHINICNLMTNFEIIDIGIYVRQGATTWRVKNGLQNLHGYWLIFRNKQ